VLAEGVETKAQLDFLAAESCNEVQGYLMGRPHPILEYSELIGYNDAAEAKQFGA
jgi:EAL domain-containing protein (putative c-di-GMP-specific phosphodiesterase class I)